MRPRRSTWVASTTSRAAPELASMPRWPRCQSLAEPSSALYWHMGETTMRFSSSRSASLIGENRAAVMDGGRRGKGTAADHKKGPHHPASQSLDLKLLTKCSCFVPMPHLYA